MSSTKVQTQQPSEIQQNGSLILNEHQNKDLLTSGQHNPIYELLVSYSSFPKEIIGQTVWSSGEVEGQPERWTHHFTDQEIQEVEAAANHFSHTKLPLTDISQTTFPLPRDFAILLENVRNEVINKKGFWLGKGLPVVKWGIEKSATIYMGLGSYLGEFISQNGKGHLLGKSRIVPLFHRIIHKIEVADVTQGHVYDLGNDATQTDKVRIYSTHAKQFFHVDDSDIVSLLCLQKSVSGGESSLVSSHHVYNILQQTRPDIVELLTQPIWYFDRKGEQSHNQDPYTRQPLLYLYEDRVILKYDPYFIRSTTRFQEAGEIPKLSKAQEEALLVLEDLATRESLSIQFDVGDLQVVSNTHVLHARGEYQDGDQKRQLLRLWLANAEGTEKTGWALPFPDSRYIKRGGIQVNDVAPRVPMKPE